MNEGEFLFKQYEVFIDLLKHLHQRWSSHFTIFMTFMGIIAASIATLLERSYMSDFSSLIKFLSLIGLTVSLFSMISFIRIRNEERLKYNQINRIEKKLEEYAADNEFTFISQSNETYKFFDNETINTLRFNAGLLSKVKNHYFTTTIFLLFALYFIYNLIAPLIKS